MTSIAHISDLHFGTEDAAVCDALRSDLLRTAPDLVVLTGDITQRARRAQFQQARAFLDSIAPLPVLALPGNHDLPLFDLLRRFTRPYRYHRQYICATLAPAWQNHQVAVLGVNSTRILRHKNGALPPAVVQEVAQRLAALPQPFKVVALHHPLAIVAPSDRHNLVKGAAQALAAWTAAGADLFLGGHIHLPYCIPSDVGARRAVILQAGTAVSTRRRGGRPNSYNVVHFDTDDGRRMQIEQRNYDARSGLFADVSMMHASSVDDGWMLRGGFHAREHVADDKV